MADASNPTSQTKIMDIRVNENDLMIIDRAAVVLGKSRAEFMVESSRHAAEDILLNRTVFVADDEDYGRFVKLLNTSEPSTGALGTLLCTPAPWE